MCVWTCEYWLRHHAVPVLFFIDQTEVSRDPPAGTEGEPDQSLSFLYVQLLQLTRWCYHSNRNPELSAHPSQSFLTFPLQTRTVTWSQRGVAIWIPAIKNWIIIMRQIGSCILKMKLDEIRLFTVCKLSYRTWDACWWFDTSCYTYDTTASFPYLQRRAFIILLTLGLLSDYLTQDLHSLISFSGTSLKSFSTDSFPLYLFRTSNYRQRSNTINSLSGS